MFPIASVKFLAAHEPDRSMPSGFGRACASIKALVAATITIAALTLNHTVSSSSHSRHRDVSPPSRTWRRRPRGSIRLFLELRRDDVRRLEIHRVVHHRGPDDEGRAVRLLEQ